MLRRFILALALALAATALSPSLTSAATDPPAMPCGGIYPPCT